MFWSAFSDVGENQNIKALEAMLQRCVFAGVVYQTETCEEEGKRVSQSVVFCVVVVVVVEKGDQNGMRMRMKTKKAAEEGRRKKSKKGKWWQKII